MPDCPFNPSDSPCDLELDLMILREAERESLEIFYAMREELHFYLNRTQLLETVLAASGRVGLILRADGALGPVYAKHSHLHFWR